MRCGICVKCGATTVYAKDDGISLGKYGVNVRTGMLATKSRTHP